jgi:integrase
MRVWKRTKHYWYEFTHEGRRVRASSKQGDKEAAKKIGAAHLTRLAEGSMGLTRPKRFTVGELLDKLEANYKLCGKFDAKNGSLIRSVRAQFGTKMSDELTAEHVESFIKKRLGEGRAPATVNRRLEILRRAYRLSKLAPPQITRLPENNVRQGFFTREEFDRVRSFLPDDLRDFVLFAYLTGMRKSEIGSLAWADLTDNVIRLRAENAKTGKPRSIVCAGELAPLLERRRTARAVKIAEGVTMAATIFHRDGAPVQEFRKSWATACVLAGLGKMVCPKCGSESAEHWCASCKRETRYRGRIFHDLRRNGVRNLVRAGVPQTVAMSISGHRTISVFQRYDITSEADLENAMLKLEAFSQPSNLREMTR